MPFTLLLCEFQVSMAAPGLQLLGVSYNRLVGVISYKTVQRTANALAVECVCLDMSNDVLGPCMRPFSRGQKTWATGLIHVGSGEDSGLRVPRSPDAGQGAAQPAVHPKPERRVMRGRACCLLDSA
jgi:hypothetical protein